MEMTNLSSTVVVLGKRIVDGPAVGVDPRIKSAH
ncbi:MAG: hypothetical protein RIS76_3756 [Verrucomicrobiota bacterium]|jgi:hypothetical protein